MNPVEELAEELWRYWHPGSRQWGELDDTIREYWRDRARMARGWMKGWDL